jgi:hypothetical protein
MGRRHTDEFAVGEDSFLDTVANLVGILIILVVIVGARSYATAKVAIEQEMQAKIEDIAEPLGKTNRLDEDIEKQQKQLQQFEMELAYRDSERIAILDRVTVAKRIVEDQTEALSDDDKQDVQVEEELNDLQKQLSNLLNQQGNLPPGEQNTAVLQHLPTPMAKTVFGREVHVMIKGGMVTVIPWEQLIEALKKEARITVERNAQKQSIVNMLGPIDGFMMRFGLLSKSGVVSKGAIATMAKVVELDRFELEPTNEIVRESAERTLRTGGRLRAELAQSASKQTTITVWVYPDSFKEFRHLKEMLFAEGYLCAARPLPENMRIGASPRGSSSTAQ